MEQRNVFYVISAFYLHHKTVLYYCQLSLKPVLSTIQNNVMQVHTKMCIYIYFQIKFFVTI